MAMATLEEIKKEYENILEQLSDPGLISNWDKFEELSKQKARLEKIIEKSREIEEINNKIEENKLIISGQEEVDLISLAETEIAQLTEKKRNLEKDLAASLGASLSSRFAGEAGAPAGRAALLGEPRPQSGWENSSAVVIEIRAGTGGEEAALFAANLYRMYSRYGQIRGWKQKTLDSRPTELGGFKEIIFELTGSDVLPSIKYEAGVHRVQRIPETEKSGRIHTSTATVAILPLPKKTEIKIDPKDLRIDFYRSSGKGGQNVNKRETAVRITHLPSGLAVASQEQRNQLQNKENAMAILEARLLEMKEKEAENKMGQKRKTQIGKAKRVEKIRTYNFPQDRVTDHRIKKSWHNIEKIMDGNLEEIVESLKKADN